ncbi:hypothetical protein [Kineococcus sp. SYSU DK018]|uniref:hypothetical protein n=1 Tax=Kineococcus sp. SYSU DK018 TaxID=3383139 RepID=UPI003D7EBCA0
MTAYSTQAAPTSTGGSDGIADGIADVLAGYVGVGIWVVLGLAVLVRLLQLLLKRRSWADKRRDVRSKVADPLVRTAAVQSTIYGWTPSGSRSMPSPPTQTTTSEDDTRRPPRTEGE